LILTGLVAGVVIWFIQHRFGEKALQRAAQETDKEDPVSAATVILQEVV